MKLTLSALTVVLLLFTATANAQFKSQVDKESRISDAIYENTGSSFLFGWFNPERFHMRHSVSMSYTTFGSSGMSLGTYTNSMMYQFTDNLNARADVSVGFSPFNSMSKMGGMQNSFTGIYLSRAEINYRPWENFFVQLQYRQSPYGSWYGSRFSDPWFFDTGF